MSLVEFFTKVMTKIHNLPIITTLVLTLCCTVTATYYLTGRTDNILFLYISESWGRQLTEVTAGQWWRLLTPVFVHLDIFHLLFNGLCFWELGKLIERRFYWPWYVALILALAIPSNLAQFLASGANFGGLSAIIYGLFAMIWSLGRFDPSSDLHLPNYLALFLLAFYALSWLGVFGHMSNVAHTVGLLLGLIIGYYIAKRSKTFPRP